ncbi:hypothetical protein ACFX5E_15430 [Flavobacterium sp. LS2P90]|uniref:NAD-dependent epimerase/dehydratase domain-containing protein n=1 Tax=Flavobacterium xylosi TaxID=3230415 RepID=A0ABW6HZJ7_9FLAO
MKKVGIISGAGIIGSYIVKAILDHGFAVNVSVTDSSIDDKYQHLMVLNKA